MDAIQKEKIRKKIVKAAGCDIQGGWPCNTCFHALKLKSKTDNHDFWLAVLALRGYPDLPEKPALIKELVRLLKTKKERGKK